MRYGFAVLVAIIALLTAGYASAVTITNLDQSSQRLFVCDDKCGPSFGEAWGSAFDFSLAPGESRSFNCSGQCFVGAFSGEQPPTLGDIAVADDDEVFQGDEAGYIRGGFATHQAN
jgi:hypothetical protein